jgi:mercuric ion transport protein
MGSRHKQGLLALPGVGVSLLPKLMCPACWPAYASVLSSLGLGFLISTTYLLPLTALFLIVAVGSLGFRASGRRGLGPLWMGVAAGALILGGKFYLESAPVTYAGIGFLIVASIWNSWPRVATSAGFCAACVPAEDGVTGEL